MRVVVQRVKRANVVVNSSIIGEISNGLLIFLGVGEDDTEKDVEYMVDKTIGLRIFQDENDKMNLSLKDINGEVLVVSQFTLYGDVRKGKRPSFTKSASPIIGKRLYEEYINRMKEQEIKVQTGEFGADMDISLLNDGPVTILIDSKKEF